MPTLKRRILQEISDPLMGVQQGQNLATQILVACAGSVHKCSALLCGKPDGLGENDHIATGIFTHTSNQGIFLGGLIQDGFHRRFWVTSQIRFSRLAFGHPSDFINRVYQRAVIGEARFRKQKDNGLPVLLVATPKRLKADGFDSRAVVLFFSGSRFSACERNRLQRKVRCPAGNWRNL
jgi:hypothetical protein